MLAWDLIPDERAPFKAIIMRFASYEAAHTALTDVGFSPTSSSVHALESTDGRTAVKSRTRTALPLCWRTRSPIRTAARTIAKSACGRQPSDETNAAQVASLGGWQPCS